MGCEGQQDIEMAILTALLKGILVLVNYFFINPKSEKPSSQKF